VYLGKIFVYGFIGTKEAIKNEDLKPIFPENSGRIKVNNKVVFKITKKKKVVTKDITQF